MQPADRGRAEHADHRRILGVTFVGSSPADILRDGHAGAEGPLNSRGAHFFRRDPPDPFDQRGIAGAAKTDVVGEHHRALHVAVAVYGVDPVQDRDAQAGLQRFALDTVVQIGPSLNTVVRLSVHLGVGIAAAQHRADEVLLHVPDVLEHGSILRLGHLPDLLVEGHLGEQRLDLRVIGRKPFWCRCRRSHLNRQEERAEGREAKNPRHPESIELRHFTTPCNLGCRDAPTQLPGRSKYTLGGFPRPTYQSRFWRRPCGWGTIPIRLSQSY